jgi:DNA helicase-2/ATP-dependent DNA helicase PcrA
VKYGGLKFLEAAHVKDVLSLLRFGTNPSSRLAGYRALRLMPGIGPATASRLLDAMVATSSPWEAMSAFRMPAAAREAAASLGTLLAALDRGSGPWPAELDPVIAWYLPQLHRLYDDPAPREADLVQLVRIASTYASRERFVTELTLDPPAAVSDEAGAPLLDDDHLVLSTIHSAKGQEWKAVHVLSAVDGCIPSDMAAGTSAELEEERRLLYVAMTRARDHLALVVPQRFHVRQPSGSADRHVHASRTRFIPASIAALFDGVAWPAPQPEPPSPSCADLPRVDLLAQVRQAWK